MNAKGYSLKTDALVGFAFYRRSRRQALGQHTGWPGTTAATHTDNDDDDDDRRDDTPSLENEAYQAQSLSGRQQAPTSGSLSAWLSTLQASPASYNLVDIDVDDNNDDEDDEDGDDDDDDDDDDDNETYTEIQASVDSAAAIRRAG